MLKVDVLQLEAIISKTWGREDELKQLKSELAALDRKITAELAPKQDEKDGTEVKQEQSQQLQYGVKQKTTSNTADVQPTNTEQGHNPSMVAEPTEHYHSVNGGNKISYRPFGI